MSASPSSMRVTFAAGLAAEGFKPFAAIYSTFLQRAYDQVVHDVAIQRLPVRFAIDRAGLVGADGPTHAGVFRRRLSRVPARHGGDGGGRRGRADAYGGDRRRASTIVPRPSAIRAARASASRCPSAASRSRSARAASCARARRWRCCPSARGCPNAWRRPTSSPASACSTTVADARFAKPLDMDLVRRLARNHEVLITVEEGSIGGFGAHGAASSRARRPARPAG